MALGMIGGSGLYDLDALTDREWRPVTTAWGDPSDELLFGRLGETELVFLPRHGRGHRLLPHEINYRANIAALKIAGCTEIVSVAACGSFREDLPPGSFVLVDQIVDRTRTRSRTFFGDGIAAHVGLADPICARLRAALAETARIAGVDVTNGGGYLCMEGPQFSTRAESRLYRRAGLDVIGMTAMPEAALAREAELCYAAIAMVTDYDSWRDDESGAETADILAVMQANVGRARELVTAYAKGRQAKNSPCASGCDRALEHAVITPREAWPQKTAEALQSIASRVMS
ncbi:S-methyl-5'-thioadenosine phosphorylase [Pacificimonas sp. WHA3]|uniref:Purine nucleoside phosphorylase n=1 Tax=Pacificimonas pallii TaxID=2827236 RepID=A0ABS6SD36_9SPHN|nr:S-methyl-5'-thioadenosine phosphorylase [Pacificimonas pallii]MBV7255836.1 S-methyl-5'-thioadenosine phosphorylase [Pacificimonas pallii]